MCQEVDTYGRQCKREFVFSAGEQQYFAAKGLRNIPRRCGECRNKRKKSGLNQPNERE
ncbi:MAG: zinc-ribbon domain containing protein [Minisyncoccia bacterium]